MQTPLFIMKLDSPRPSSNEYKTSKFENELLVNSTYLQIILTNYVFKFAGVNCNILFLGVKIIVRETYEMGARIGHLF